MNETARNYLNAAGGLLRWVFVAFVIVPLFVIGIVVAFGIVGAVADALTN